MIVRNTSPSVPDPYVTWAPLLPANIRNPLARPIGVREAEETLEADMVVLATGLVPAARPPRRVRPAARRAPGVQRR